MKSPAIVVTCEHATAAVPESLSRCFKNAEAVLETHRAYDPGARETARELARRLGVNAPLEGSFTRLLIDLNRSLHHPRVFSEFSPPPGDPARAELVASYTRFREAVTGRLREALAASDEAIHFSVHSFTPVLEGRVRNLEVGLLYDPHRLKEKRLCEAIRQRIPHPHRVRMNAPYRGGSDGFTRTLRRELGERYLGIELELNHGAFFNDPPAWANLRVELVTAVSGAVATDRR